LHRLIACNFVWHILILVTGIMKPCSHLGTVWWCSTLAFKICTINILDLLMNDSLSRQGCRVCRDRRRRKLRKSWNERHFWASQRGTGCKVGGETFLFLPDTPLGVGMMQMLSEMPGTVIVSGHHFPRWLLSKEHRVGALHSIQQLNFQWSIQWELSNYQLVMPLNCLQHPAVPVTLPTTYYKALPDPVLLSLQLLHSLIPHSQYAILMSHLSFSTNTQNMFLSQDLCTCSSFFIECSPDYFWSSTSQLKCSIKWQRSYSWTANLRCPLSWLLSTWLPYFINSNHSLDLFVLVMYAYLVIWLFQIVQAA
jgi:hypothetical protein